MNKTPTTKEDLKEIKEVIKNLIYKTNIKRTYSTMVDKLADRRTRTIKSVYDELMSDLKNADGTAGKGLAALIFGVSASYFCTGGPRFHKGRDHMEWIRYCSSSLNDKEFDTMRIEVSMTKLGTGAQLLQMLPYPNGVYNRVLGIAECNMPDSMNRANSDLNKFYKFIDEAFKKGYLSLSKKVLLSQECIKTYMAMKDLLFQAKEIAVQELMEEENVIPPQIDAPPEVTTPTIQIPNPTTSREQPMEMDMPSCSKSNKRPTDDGQWTKNKRYPECVVDFFPPTCPPVGMYVHTVDLEHYWNRIKTDWRQDEYERYKCFMNKKEYDNAWKMVNDFAVVHALSILPISESFDRGEKRDSNSTKILDELKGAPFLRVPLNSLEELVTQFSALRTQFSSLLATHTQGVASLERPNVLVRPEGPSSAQQQTTSQSTPNTGAKLKYRF